MTDITDAPDSTEPARGARVPSYRRFMRPGSDNTIYTSICKIYVCIYIDICIA